jgi:hypothetical protein
MAKLIGIAYKGEALSSKGLKYDAWVAFVEGVDEPLYTSSGAFAIAAIKLGVVDLTDITTVASALKGAEVEIEETEDGKKRLKF